MCYEKDHCALAGNDASSAAEATGTEFTAALSNGQTYHVYAANPFYAATVAERNDTRSPYKVTIPTTSYNATVVNPGESASAELAVSDYKTANSVDNVGGTVTDLGDINVTNNLDSLDPTGLRDGMIPYIIIAALAVMGLGAGVVVSLKKKPTESES